MDRNICLICLDSVRKDYFDQHAPRVTGRADISIDHCRTASSWTLPSHASMFTGLLPHQHKVHINNRDFSQIDSSNTFLHELHGYRKVGISANFHAGSTFGFDSLFDDFTDVSMYRRFEDGMDVRQFIHESDSDGVTRYIEFLNMIRDHDSPMKSLLNGLVSKLNYYYRYSPIPKLFDEGANYVSRNIIKEMSKTDKPVFIFANYMEGHPPYEHIRGFDKNKHSATNDWTSRDLESLKYDELNDEDINNYRGLYAASIDYLDRKLNELINSAQTTSDRETTFIITADHGENLGYESDGGIFGHSDSMSEALLHVPLYIINPPEEFTVADEPYFSHLDLGTLILNIAFNNKNDFLYDTIAAERPGSYSYRDTQRVLRCVYDKNEKIMWDSTGDISKSVIEHNKPCKSKFQGHLDEIPKFTDQFFSLDISDFEDELNEAQQQQLRDLGYL
jgi:membrane-anchored protein YejM (alkaline phosphatase superfamily)